MAALRILLVLLLLPLHAIAASSSDGVVLLAAKSVLSDPTGALADWRPSSDGGSPCRWKHVSCSNESTGAVVGLYLSNLFLFGLFPDALCSLQSLDHLDFSYNSIVGTLPACLAALPTLTHLNLAENDFYGEVPPAWGAGFRSLTVLNLIGNFLTGEFPAFVANLTALQEVRVAYNPFSPSPLPENLGDLTDLRVLFVANCSLIGNIPSSVGRLRNLVNLDVSSNNLSGQIPGTIRNLISLEQMELYSNQLTGKIPVGLGGLKNLQRLDMSMNRLNGKIPEDMFRAPRLESVHMYQNNLTGRLPATLGTAAQSLSDLKIFSNQLEGPVPPELGKNNYRLEIVDMSDNRLSGPIPTSICASGKLAQLLLFDNEFEGAIPVELGRCWTLTRVRLQSNRLSGPVPPEFWGLPRAVLLELNDNALSGTVDPAIGGAKNLSMLLIQHNKFTGTLPTELGSLPLLQLMASNNNFSGPLPPSLAELSRMYTLDLSSNSLSGGILPGFGKLKNLTLMNLSCNHLSGSIPPELGNVGGMNSLDLSYNELSGSLPVQLSNLKLCQFNASYNKLSGSIPRYFNTFQFRDSFLGNPDLCRTGFCQGGGGNSGIINRHTFVKSAVPILVALVIILLVCLSWLGHKWRTRHNDESSAGDEKMSSSGWVLTSFHKMDFNEREIVKSLGENNVIGQGASGPVYKAVVGTDGQTMAVKKLWRPSGDAGSCRMRNYDSSFEAEVETLSKVRHRNIVKLFCCLTNRAGCRLLVYEYMPNGSLGDVLHGARSSSILAWPMRYKIACDAAEGLSYLHHDCVPPIVHRDVKSNNILLDADFGAKVADFGLSRTIGNEPATMSVVAGSYGYIAPEYAYTLRVTEKTDIYSFGVVILELVTGKKPMAPEINEMDLVSWVSTNIERNGPESVLDQQQTTLDAQFKDEMRKVLRIGRLCVANLPNNRPPMRVVVKMLRDVKGSSCCQPKVTTDQGASSPSISI